MRSLRTTANVKIVDDTAVVVLPDEVVQKLRLQDGSEIGCVLSPNGVELVSDLRLAEQLRVAREVMDEDREALRELAK